MAHDTLIYINLGSIVSSSKDQSTKMTQLVLYLLLQVILFLAWVSGYLDPYQKKMQEIILDAMGDNRVSYGLKSEL